MTVCHCGQKEAPLRDRSWRRDSFSVNIPFIAVSRRWRKMEKISKMEGIVEMRRKVRKWSLLMGIESLWWRLGNASVRKP